MVHTHVPNHGKGIIQRAGRGPEAVVDQVDQMRCTVVAAFDSGFQGKHLRPIAVVLRNAELYARAIRLGYETHCILPIGRHAFFDQHVLARIKRQPRQRGVEKPWVCR